MKKNRKNGNASKEASGGSQRTLWLASVIRDNLYTFVIREGMKALDTMLEQDRERLCGPAHARGGPDDALRWGATDGRLVMAGQSVVVRKPRAESWQGGQLPTWAQFADEDPLDARTVEQMVVGVSTRNYERSIESLPDELGAHGASKSAASRRFVELTAEKLQEWLERDISDLKLVAIMIDGIEVNGEVIVVALGIDEGGQKYPLGLWHGATENATVCEALLKDLIERGLDSQQPYLFVIDGSKALRKAIRDVFGKRSLVQRCQEHKRRNVLGHLPQRLHPSISKAMRDAYQSSSRATAKRRLLQLVSRLEDDYPDAAASLREGLEETITLKDMGLPKWLERTLSTTNPIENLNGTIRRVTRNVKRWRDGAMIRRWVATAILEAEGNFRRLRGYKGMPLLVAALRDPEQTTLVDETEHAA